MSINRQEFTNAGRDMLGRANAGENLTITGVVIGSGRANAPADLWPRTELFSPEMNIGIIQQVDQGDGILLVDAAFNSSQAPNAFELCELGVMAHIGAEPDRLYSVANVLATGADNVDPAVESIHAFKVKVVIDRAPNVTVVIGTSGDILVENIGAETVGPGWFREKIGNTLRFKRAVAGFGIELTENPLDPFSVEIAQRVLAIDLDLYVALGNLDVFPNFSSIPNALDYLTPISIPPERTATIHVDSGVYLSASPITITHPNSDRIQIIGTLGTTRAVASVTNPSGGVIRLTGAAGAFDGLAVGDFIGVQLSLVTANAQGATASGVWQITARPSNTELEYATGRAGWLAFTGVTGNVFPLTSVLTFGPGIRGISIRGNGLLLLANFAVVGTASGTTIINGINNSVGVAQFRQVGVSAWTDPSNVSQGFINSGSGYLRLDNCYSSRNSDGAYFLADGEIVNSFININLRRGLWLLGSALVISSTRTCGNAGAGLFLTSGASLTFSGTESFYNAQGGISQNASHASFYGDQSFISVNTPVQDVFLNILSSLQNSGAPPLSYVTTNTPANAAAVSADGCLFRPGGALEEEEGAETLPEI